MSKVLSHRGDHFDIWLRVSNLNVLKCLCKNTGSKLKVCIKIKDYHNDDQIRDHESFALAEFFDPLRPNFGKIWKTWKALGAFSQSFEKSSIFCDILKIGSQICDKTFKFRYEFRFCFGPMLVHISNIPYKRNKYGKIWKKSRIREKSRIRALLAALKLFGPNYWVQSKGSQLKIYLV